MPYFPPVAYLATANTFTANQVINASGAAIPASSGAALTVTASGANNAVCFDAIAGAGGLNGRRTNGSAGSPTAVAVANQLAIFSATGYGSTGYVTGNKAVVDILATETWTDTACGTVVRFRNCTTGGAALIEGFRTTSLGAVVNFATSLPAGGTAGEGLQMYATLTTVCAGSGPPTRAAPQGSLYLRSDGTTVNNRLYVNSDGGTTWIAVTTVG